MKKFLIAAGLALLAVPAGAQTISYFTISSATYSGVTVSNSVATRVDNLNQGVTGQVLANRTHIVISIPQVAAAKVQCGYDANVTTSGGTMGVEYSTGTAVMIPLPTQMAYYCKAQGGGSVAIAIQQITPWKPGSRTIPGSP
jgi:hypothetical protein